MAIWISVYCRASLHGVQPEQLLQGIRGHDPQWLAGVDYITLAEDYGVTNETVVKEALLHLAVTNVGGNGFQTYEVRYGEGTQPVVVRRWHQAERVRQEIEEVQERLTVRSSAQQDQLRATIEVVGIELRPSHLDDMGVVIAYEIARYLAQRGDGLVLNDLEEWLQVDAGAFVSLSGP